MTRTGRQALMYAARGAALASLVALLAACGGSSAYPAKVKSNFLAACEVRASAAACTCEFAYIEKHVSLSTFTAADKAIRAGSRNIPPWLFAAASACASRQPTGTTTT